MDRGGAGQILPTFATNYRRPPKIRASAFQNMGVAKVARQTPPCDLLTIPIVSPQPLVSRLVRASVKASSFSVTIRNTSLAVRPKVSGFLKSDVFERRRLKSGSLLRVVPALGCFGVSVELGPLASAQPS